MRPPLPSLTLSRRVKISLAVVVTIIVLLIVAANLVGVYINWLWFGEVGFRGVYRGIITTKLVLFLIFGVLMAAILGGNIVIAYMLRPPFRPLSTEQQNLERYRVILEQRKWLILGGIMGLAGLSAGLSSMDDWRTWMLWRYGGSFGIKDPQFHRDISFFAWDYPAYRLMLGFGFTAILFSILLATAVHYLFGAIRVQTPGPKITMAARRHLTILIFIFIVLKALAYWLDRYGIVFSNRGKVTGASYTDVNASLPAKTTLFWIAVIIAIAVLASLWLKSAQLPAIAFGVLLVLSILINGIYPAIVQQFSVKPNANVKEAPYIKRNIQATREGYDVITAGNPGGTVNYVDYPAVSSPSTDALTPSSATISNIRILDPNVVSPTFLQQQKIRNQYGFATKLDMDRYQVGGVTKDYVVGVRELNADALTGSQTNWINKHTVYTHGFGFVAAQAGEDVTSGNGSVGSAPGDYTEGDIPPAGSLTIAQPQAYYGELGVDYSIVGANGSREYDGSDQTTSYKGKGGVHLDNFFTRLAFAVKYKETNFLLNSAVSNKGAKIIFNRDPRDRVLKVAPFLKVDGDPYPAVVDGRIVWIVDAYTTMSNYPYSEQQSLSSLTQDTLSRQNRTASQPNDKINYIRNSVKATVDAYDGTIHLYEWDSNDPVLKAWEKAFPGLIQPKGAMPADILPHIRYPEDLFEVQRAILEQYHVDDPVTFYNVRDKWTVPLDPAGGGSNQPPYYVLADPPTGTSNTPQFQLTTPMKVNNSQNLAAYISVDCDPANYGKITVLKLPTKSVIQGPEQISNIFNTTAVISKDITQLSGAGSTVIHGNLLTVPIGNSFLYVEPLYVQGTTGTGYPILQRVLVVYGDKVGYATGLGGALNNLSNGLPPGASINVPGQTSQPSSSPPPSSSAPPPSSAKPPSSSTPPAPPPANNAQAILTQLNTAFERLQAAYKTGDLAKIGQAQAEVQRLTQEYINLISKSASPSKPPSPTPTR
ncbi:MAG TPA: UPF0182 family protein [Jatrophihabitantaceae bacterium]|nr:UPF0182 family protein [Jatrophihabitantaceae bacterium]